MKNLLILIFFLVGLGIFLFFSLKLSSPPAAVKNKIGNLSGNPQVVALVNGTSVSKADFEKELAFKKLALAYSKQEEEPMSVEKEVLEKMIDEQLVLQYAASRNISVSEADVATRYSELIRSAGSEEKYLAKIKAAYNIEKDDYLKRLRMEVFKIKVQEDLKKPLIDYLQETKKKVRLEKAF